MVIDQWGVHGRGMALFSIRSNAVEARIAESELHKGASLVIVTDSGVLTERADQSTWPIIERDEAGDYKVVRGPHNVVRRIVEFAVEHPGIEVYYGTPTEIITTMSSIGRSELDASELLFCDNLSRLPIWQRHAAAADAGELVDIAESLGVEISERTAHRILGGELLGVKPGLQLATGSVPAVPEQATADIYRDRRGLKLHHTDVAEFRRELEAAFDTIAERYYLHLKCEPKITVGKDDIRVRCEVEKED
jgi:hypothetical protein